MSSNPDFIADGFREFPAPPAPDRAFGIWAAPGSREVIVALLPATGRRTPASVPAWFSPGFFASPSSAPWFPALQHYSVARDALERFLRDAGPTRPAGCWQDLAQEQATLEESVGGVLDRVREGSLLKAVPIAFLNSRQRHTPSPRELAWLVLAALRFQERSGGTLYGLWNASEGILGVTPELLFERQNGRVLTMALAGTRGFDPTGGSNAETREQAQAALLADEKERREHQWVIDGITESLSDLGQVTIGDTGIRQAGSLIHLHTPIELNLPESSDSNSGNKDPWNGLLNRLHPTPALGAYPKAAGMQWLLEQDSRQRRHRFGAPFGIRLDDQESCVVAIRNLEWNSPAGFCRIGAGAGVVEGSTPDREWREIRRKWNAVLKIFGLESLS